MSFISRRDYRGYVSLILLWLGSRILPFVWFTDGRHCIWEVLEVRKLLEYGFWARKGAVLAPSMYFGILPNPADYNYVNHPYPLLDFYAFLYWLTGETVLLVIMAFIGLAGYLLSYRLLKQFFPAGPACMSAGLFLIAQANVEFDIDINIVAEAALIWPVSLLAITALHDRNHRLNRWAPLLLGVVVLIAGQASWFALSTIPALLLLCLPAESRLRDMLKRPWAVRGWSAIIIGGTLTLLLFIGQILAYSPSLHGNAEYLRLQIGAGNPVAARLIQGPVLLLRMLFAGPALLLGAVTGIVVYRKASLQQRRLLGAMLVYLGAFLVMILLIPRLVFLNQHAFRYTLFPCAMLTAFGLSRFNFKWLAGALGCLALIGLLLCYAKLHDYQSSTASLVLGKWLAANTAPQEVVLSNIKYLTPPIRSWDGEFGNNVREMSDRLYFQEIGDATSFAKTAGPFLEHGQQICFLREASQPIEQKFARELEGCATAILGAQLTVPEQGLPFYKQARASLWNLMKGHAPQYAPTTTAGAVETNSFVFTMYQLRPSVARTIGKNN